MIKNGCGQSGQFSKTEQMEQTDFSHAGTNSGKLKVDSMIFVWAWSKIAEAFQFMRL